MNIIHSALILLLRSAVTGECYSLPDELDLEAVFKEAKRHSVFSMAYVGAINCKVDKDLPIMKRLLSVSFAEALFSERQMLSVDRISRAFEDNGIDYMLLKGCNMKKRYPKPEMRAMGDADILIREKDYEKARELVEGLGFVKDNKDGDHSRNFTSRDLYLELHVRFIARDEHPALAEYFGDGWKNARLVDGHRYEIPVEDEFIFSFVHFFKHYVYNGVGLKHIIDLWIFLEKESKMNLEYVEKELEGLGNLTFYKNVTNSLNVLFFEENGDEKTKIIIERVLECGTWGTAQTAAIRQGSSNRQNAGKLSNARAYTVFRAIFPSLKVLKKQYPILQKHAYLLPFMWVARWVEVIVHNRYKIAYLGKRIKVMSDEKIDDYEAKLRFVGINLAD